jgi:hypothetical protein
VCERERQRDSARTFSDSAAILRCDAMRCRVFWTEAAANAVVVEADAFKESDVIYQAISSRGHHTDMLQTAELVRRSDVPVAAAIKPVNARTAPAAQPR